MGTRPGLYVVYFLTHHNLHIFFVDVLNERLAVGSPEEHCTPQEDCMPQNLRSHHLVLEKAVLVL